MSNRSDQFFVWLWRVNGLLLFGLGLMGIVGAGLLVFGTSLSRREEPQLTNVADANLADKGLALAEFRQIAGSGSLYAQLVSQADYLGLSSRSGAGVVHNLLFFDTAAKTAHWLLPGNEQTLPSVYFLMDPPAARNRWYGDEPAEKPGQVTLAMLVELQRDPPKHNPSGRRTRSLVVTSADGRDLTTVLPAIDRVLGYHQPAKDSVLVFYTLDGAVKVLDLDPLARKVRSDGLLSTRG